MPQLSLKKIMFGIWIASELARLKILILIMK